MAALLFLVLLSLLLGEALSTATKRTGTFGITGKGLE